MSEQLEDTHLVDMQPLIAPRAVKAELPLTEQAAELVSHTRQAVRAILHGRDQRRLLVVTGPCSIHDAEAAYEYAGRLKKVIDATRDRLVIVMRTYFEKPRTTVGWKGLINDPHLDGSCDIPTGLQMARQILLHINQLGVPCAVEVLDPVTPQYVADLISWAAIGARTTESQTHRELASGLSMPIGFKNGTDGKVQSAINAMISARHPHSFLGINADGLTCMVKTGGNPDRHIVLRGGGGKPNCGPEDIARAVELVAGEEIARAVMVDCSHDNSGKDHTKQGQVCRDALAVFRDAQSALMGLLIESNLKPGKQTWKGGVQLDYGVSITDACIGWEETEQLLYEIAEAVPPQ
ncbi:MAG: 3-deoxy-7-phosphoheptulonate synthase [Desulfurellaceae bacterium]|nr:3-deoxy-7-phosphoheptulonate synthase [Desulfurellaceae bacterium]